MNSGDLYNKLLMQSHLRDSGFVPCYANKNCVGARLSRFTRGHAVNKRNHFSKLMISANSMFFIWQDAIAHDPQGIANIANQTILVSFVLFLIFAGISYRISKSIAQDKSSRIRILIMLAFILASFALSMFVIYPVLFFIAMWLL